VYSACVVATYPGTVSPLRGLDPFGEAERDVWHGREQERDDLAKMVIADGFRAGLVYGEPGVGKTSLVRAGLIPHLRDHGIVALACEDIMAPAASFAAGLSAFGIQPQQGELPVMFVQRAVANAVAGQQFVFVVDDVDILCMDDRAMAELADLFSRVVSRSAGRARFLFVCAHERMHALAALERKTGSLFPPSARYELTRLSPQKASQILDRILALSGVAADPALADAVVQGIGRNAPMLAADLQLAALAMRALSVTSAQALAKLGGPTELESAWLHEACKATGNERSALRLVAELATGPGPVTPRLGEEAIRRINLDMEFGQSALLVLEQKGVIARVDPSGTTWVLRHEILNTRVRELTAPARAAARQAFDLLGSKTQNKSRLKLRELRKLKTEGIAPVTPEERDVVARSKRFYMMVAGAIAAVPLVIIIMIWISMSGRVYFDLAPRVGGDHVMIRGGRAGLSGFHWLPGSFGDSIADTGFTRSMVKPEEWKKIEAQDIGMSAGEWAAYLDSIMAPQLAGLVDYATTGNEGALEALRKAAKDNPDDIAELLISLRPIARGGPAEVAFVESALAIPSPAVQRAAVATAGNAAARRQGDVYQETLTKALISSDAELRRIAFAAVRNLGAAGKALFEAALKLGPEAEARRELLVEVSTVAVDTDAPSAASAVAVLSDPEASAPLKDKAKGQIRGALVKDAAKTAEALTALISQDRASPEARVFAIELLNDLDPLPTVTGLAEAARAANASRSPIVRAAALPLYAKIDPVRAGGELAQMLEDKKLEKSIRVAAALAWGNVAKSNKDAVANALDRMLKEDDADVRAAAAAALGKLGRQPQERLIKMVKNEVFVVRIGAAQGLANSAESGGNPSYAVDGIAQMWREKGRPRREAARIFAHLARKKPQFVTDYLYQAAHVTDDPGLHPIGVEGLCNAALAGSPDARRSLARSLDDTVEVRRIVMSCVADGPEPAKNGSAIALKLVKDPDNGIRSDAARVLALAASKGTKVAGNVADALVGLLDDPDRDVRLVAIRAVGGMGPDSPKSATAVMARRFDRGDEGEKLALLRAAKAILAEDILALAITDSSPLVRVEAVDAALESGLRASATLSAALADSDPQVRKAALERLAAQKEKLEPALLERALALAVRDPNPELSQLALTTIARVSPKDAVLARLSRSLASRAERERAQAAAAAVGLVDRDPQRSIQLLEPLLDDPSHDVRVAMLPALGAAYAKTNTPEKLAALMTDSEDHAMRRLVAAAAFVTLAKTDTGAKAADAVLAKIKTSGPPMAAFTAKLVAGLLAGKADGMTFLQELVP